MIGSGRAVVKVKPKEQRFVKIFRVMVNDLRKPNDVLEQRAVPASCPAGAGARHVVDATDELGQGEKEKSVAELRGVVVSSVH